MKKEKTFLNEPSFGEISDIVFDETIHEVVRGAANSIKAVNSSLHELGEEIGENYTQSFNDLKEAFSLTSESRDDYNSMSSESRTEANSSVADSVEVRTLSDEDIHIANAIFLADLRRTASIEASTYLGDSTVDDRTMQASVYSNSIRDGGRELGGGHDRKDEASALGAFAQCLGDINCQDINCQSIYFGRGLFNNESEEYEDSLTELVDESISSGSSSTDDNTEISSLCSDMSSQNRDQKSWKKMFQRRRN